MGLQAGTAAEYDKAEAEKYKAWPLCVRMGHLIPTVGQRHKSSDCCITGPSGTSSTLI